MNIQFGSGSNRPDGWVNTDLPDVDITKPLPYPDNSADRLLAEHVFEHIGPHEAFRFLEECRRVLKPGGVLRLLVPVLERLEPEHARDIILGNDHKGIYTETLIFHMLRVVGFSYIYTSERKECDGHHRAIGAAKDDLETCRFEAVK